MKRVISILTVMAFLLVLISGCASDPRRYNTQRGAGIGAGVGAAIGGIASKSNTWQGLLIGAAVGTLVGAVFGNAVDQTEQAKIDAAQTNQRVVYVDNQNRAVEAIPQTSQRTNCRKVTTNIYDNGTLVSSKTEEVCTGKKTTPTY